MKNERQNVRGPIYKKIVDMVCQKIRDGEWPAGHKLPTVRELADEANISCGTVKHAYDELELLGMIEMTQGRGTFVRADVDKGNQGKKETAMRAIEELFNDLERLGFSEREIRIFLDLKLREREEMYKNVRVGVIDCNPEALSIIESQLSALPDIDVYRFLLDDVMQAPYSPEENLDLLLTTSNHLVDVENIVVSQNKLMFMVLSPSQNTVMELAKIGKDMKVGILCTSRKFADIIRMSSDRFCTLDNPPDLFLLGDGPATEAFAAEHDVLIMPPDYLKFCDKQEENALLLFQEKGKKIVLFDYQIDKGSFFYLKERIERLRKLKK